MGWPSFVKKCSKTLRTSETYEEYLDSKKKKQSLIKSKAGYFIGGKSTDNSRKRDSITNRSLLTLDIDHGVEGMSDLVEGCYSDFEYCIYSTHKHSDEKPRLRLVFPLSEPIDSDEYESLARQVADDLGMDYFDDTTYQHSRIMFWPTTAKDGDWVFIHNKGEFLDSDEYAPFTIFPMSSREANRPKRSKTKQVEDPRTKNGIIGAFCREYSIPEVIDEFLSDIYEETSSADRYSFVGGSTSGGAVVYDDESILFSQHESDPAHGFSQNAYDLVRIHLVGEDADLSDMNAWISREAIHVIENLTAEEFEDDIEDEDEDGETKKVGKDEFLRLSELIETVETEDDLFGKVMTQLAFAKLSTIDIARLSDKVIKSAKALGTKITPKAVANSIKETQALQTTGEESGLQIDDDYRTILNRNIFVTGIERVVDVSNMHFIKMQVFNTLHKAKLEVGDPLAELVNEKIIKKCHETINAPGEKMFFKEEGINFLNTYQTVKIKPKPGDVSPMLEHIAFVLESQYEQNIILDFIAYIVQNPGKKIRWMPIIKGGKGIGKTMIAEDIIWPVLGRKNVGATDAKSVYDDPKDQSWKINSQLVVFNEMDCKRDRVKFTDDMKTFITDKYISARQMYKGSDTFKNRTNALGFTNAENALVITEDERRFCMMESLARPQEASYYDGLGRWLSDERNQASMLHHFKTRDLSEFTPNRVPETEYTKAIKEESKSWLSELLEISLIEEVWPFGIDVMTFKNIENFISLRTPDTADRWETKRDRVLVTLKECGFDKYRKPGRARRTVQIDGHEESIWMRPCADVKAIYKLEVEDVISMIKEYKNPDEEDFDD